MFSLFNLFKKKTVKVLVVVNGDAHEPIDYFSKIDTDMKAEIRSACNALAIAYDDNLIDEIESYLVKGNTYWHNENFGFEILKVEV